MIKYLCFLLFNTCYLFSSIDHSFLAVGGGYFFAGQNHSSELWEIKYFDAKKIYNIITPQLSIISPRLHSIFVGIGLGVEIPVFTKMLLIPNFSPGIYFPYHGKNLGSPLEFLSAIELFYLFNNGFRLGVQFFHISNASISQRNPGANAALLLIATPLP